MARSSLAYNNMSASDYESENVNSANFKSSRVQKLLDKTRKMIEF
jgi:hypothetical protein